ncbi:complex I NDUFA9 subunit family protein [Bosea sp. (in: a-proteobacteria)]|uniref:complex I NDUFA9 subunit family protein n=1 Tax=Bosea sp. (in: a-proteobacteria) TaxID=1871050 RepID=UPI0026364C08|nr:complex I NDUFA9 subunit family protein [Bosea sp. (in: a-proteobacteria)]MCO5091360.1 complex I NDUFA9 subunit family protein [Bosea sp. (in: a-proteobacteria)]
MASPAPAQQLVTVFGGSGFVGRHVVRALVKRGYRVRVAVRRPDLAGFLQPLGVVGQIHAVQANLRYPASVTAAVRGADAVVNLVGIMQEQGRQGFSAVQANGARAVAQACAAAGIARLTHVSALGADAESASIYARSKAEGEAAVFAAVPGAVVLRPSVMFGPEDSFFNRFASLARMLPVLPLIGDGATQFQPAFVGDVAEIVARAVDGTVPGGRVYELGGPEVLSLRQIVEEICRITGRKRLIAPLPFPLARIMGSVLQVADALTLGLIPDELVMTRDQVTLLESDNVVSPAAVAEGRDFAGLGLAPTSSEAIVPAYLWRFRRTGQFDTLRDA